MLILNTFLVLKHLKNELYTKDCNGIKIKYPRIIEHIIYVHFESSFGKDYVIICVEGNAVYIWQLPIVRQSKTIFSQFILKELKSIICSKQFSKKIRN